MTVKVYYKDINGNHISDLYTGLSYPSKWCGEIEMPGTVYPLVPGTPDEWESAYTLVSKKTWRLQYRGTFGGNSGYDGTCYYGVVVEGPKYAVHGYGGTNTNYGNSCNLGGSVPPDPVTCYLHTPDTMFHPPASTGHVRRTAQGEIHVSCTADSRVALAVQNSELQLESNGHTLKSDLYLEKEGQTWAYVDATPNGTAKLISVIDAQADTPGSYQGSKVIIANLP